MDTKVFMTIAMAIISIAGTLITAYVIPWIKANISEKDFNKIIKWSRLAVRCADQIFTPEQWEQKKEYVMQYIIDKCNKLGLKLSEVDINTLIEAMVNQIHHGGEE